MSNGQVPRIKYMQWEPVLYTSFRPLQCNTPVTHRSPCSSHEHLGRRKMSLTRVTHHFVFQDNRFSEWLYCPESVTPTAPSTFLSSARCAYRWTPRSTVLLSHLPSPRLTSRNQEAIMQEKTSNILNLRQSVRRAKRSYNILSM
jgi:hypothetical protein